MSCDKTNRIRVKLGEAWTTPRPRRGNGLLRKPRNGEERGVTVEQYLAEQREQEEKRRRLREHPP